MTPRTLKDGHKYTNWLTDAQVEQAIQDGLPKKVTLCYAERDHTVKDKKDEIQETLEIDFSQPDASIYDKLNNVVDDDWVSDSAHYYIDELTKDHLRPAIETLLEDTEMQEEYLSAEIDEILDAARDYIQEQCYTRDDSSPLEDLLRNTPDMNLVGQLQSNEGGLGWSYINGAGAVTYDGYLKIIIDVLQLNPAVVKVGMKREGRAVSGRWPDRPNREPYVKYQDFMRELDNLSSESNELTFLAKLDLSDLPDYRGKVLFPKGNYVGLFDRHCGSGSVLDMELLRDFKFVQDATHRGCPFDKYRLRLDDTIRYGVQDVYGLTSNGWASPVKMLP